MSVQDDEQLRETWLNVQSQPTPGQLGYLTDDRRWQRETLKVDETDGGSSRRMFVRGHPPDEEDDGSKYAEQWIVIDRNHVFEQQDWR